MESIWLISLIALWGAVIINLLLTLRVVRSLRREQEVREQFAERETLPELSVGVPAPDFSVRTLAGSVVELATYAGQSVVFIFVSPHCGNCRRRLPLLVKLSMQAKKRGGVEFVLVSDSTAAETFTWINTIREEDGVEIHLPILIAPFSRSDFLKIYNPRGLTPYYCLINEQGIVQARDPLGMGEWSKLQQEWEGPTKINPFPRLYT